MICSAPVLVAPHMDKLFKKQLDAIMLGHITLLDNEAAVDLPAIFFHLSIWALQHFEVCVDAGCNTIVVYTDQNSLTFSLESKSTSVEMVLFFSHTI